MPEQRTKREEIDPSPRYRAKASRSNRVVQWLLWCRPALASGVLLWLSFPPVGWSPLAWFALVPMLTCVRGSWSSQPIYRPVWLGGLVFGLLAVQWIRFADDSGLSGYYGWWALAAYLSLYFPLFVLAVRVSHLRFRVPLIVAVPVAWVGLEYLRSWFFSGFAWYFLSHTQYGWVALIQIADFAGAYGVSFVVATVNAWLLDLLAVPLVRVEAGVRRIEPRQIGRLVFVVAIIGSTFGYGYFRTHGSAGDMATRTRVALIQTNIPQLVKEDPDRFPEINQQYLRLLADAVASEPSLIIWPETAYRTPLIDIAPDVTDDDLRRLYPNERIEPERIRQVAANVRDDLVFLARRGGVPMLMGINTEVITREQVKLYNSAVLVWPDGTISKPYHKMVLVPWGEYLPLRRWVPWTHIFTPHASADYGLEAGGKAVRFHTTSDILGVLICFEDTVPWIARRYVQHDSVDEVPSENGLADERLVGGNEVTMLVNISNDGWFGTQPDDSDSARLSMRAEHAVHLAISVFRAVECRKPMVRAVNTGVSAIIDAEGRIVRRAGDESGGAGMTSEVLVGMVGREYRKSWYVRWGDWLGIVCFALTSANLVGAVAAALVARMNRASAARRQVGPSHPVNGRGAEPA